MKEIKFRAWDNIDQAMVDWVWFKESPENAFDIVETSKELYLMQYTGLKDKNGKEIYEGDVIEINAKYSTSGDELHPEQRFIVTWRDIFYSSFDEIKGKIVDIKYDLLVIGNIYENPELLKNRCD